MTDIEQKALALLNEIRTERGFGLITWFDREEDIDDIDREALCRAIEQHEALRQEVSDAVVKATHTMAAGKLVEASGILAAFIIPKPVDPLVEAIADYKRTKGTGEYATNKDMADALRAALAARGLEVRKIGEKAGE